MSHYLDIEDFYGVLERSGEPKARGWRLLSPPLGILRTFPGFPSCTPVQSRGQELVGSITVTPATARPRTIVGSPARRRGLVALLDICLQSTTVFTIRSSSQTTYVHLGGPDDRSAK